MKFTNEQIERYSRQIILKKIGVPGQKKLLKSSVLIVGAGGLGSPVAIYLAAIGVGNIGIIDKDKVLKSLELKTCKDEDQLELVCKMIARI